MKISLYRTSRAFTLVELMIVIAIIGILAAALFPSMTSYLARGRDTVRISDLKKIQTALFMRYQDIGSYIPDAYALDSSQGASGSWSSVGVGRNGWDPNGVKTLQPLYIPKVPIDPVNTGDFFYQYEPVHNQEQFGVTCATTSCAYIISARLENTNNAQANLVACNLLGLGHHYCLSAGITNVPE